MVGIGAFKMTYALQGMTDAALGRMASDALARAGALHQAQIDRDQKRSDWINERADALVVKGADFDPSATDNISEAAANCAAQMQRNLTQAWRSGDDAALGRVLRQISEAYWADRSTQRAADEYDERHDKYGGRQP
jgi:hypothetical protein